MQPIIKMKKFFYIFLSTLVFQVSQAQIHELGVFVGGSNFVGDVGKTQYIDPNKPALGLLYKWNKSPRLSWRFSLMHTKIKANDADSELESRKERGLSFENTITEVSAGFEFNFFDFNQHLSGFKSTPYIHSGISYFGSDNLYVLNKQYQVEDSSWKLAIPIVAGIKMKIANSLILGIESGVRYTFVDDLDGSLPKNSQFDSLKFGNTNSNDWYVFTGATLTYTFGKKPCYCKD